MWVPGAWTSGATRFVLLTQHRVIKLPRWSSWRSFLNGLLANMQEAEFSRAFPDDDRLCPVQFALPLGLLVVMPRATPLTDEEFDANESHLHASFAVSAAGSFVVPVEWKPSSFGWLDGEITAIDYG